jgi:hypothetical protein
VRVALGLLVVGRVAFEKGEEEGPQLPEIGVGLLFNNEMSTIAIVINNDLPHVLFDEYVIGVEACLEALRLYKL